MSVELKIPEVGESIQEVQIGKWLKQEGDQVAQDEQVVELETDKASMELPAPSAGVLSKILKREGETVSIGDVIAQIEQTDGRSTKKPSREKAAKTRSGTGKKKSKQPKSKGEKSKREKAQPESEQREQGTAQPQEPSPAAPSPSAQRRERRQPYATPSARRALRQYGLTEAEVEASGDQLRREDVERYVQQARQRAEPEPEPEQPIETAPAPRPQAPSAESELEQVVPMSLIRRRIAQRLVEAQQRAALLTTFNEIDMSQVIQLRRQYREPFQEEYGIKLGFMPFFVKAAVDALLHFPEVNAEIRDDNIAYRHYYHIGIAIGGGKGLVVPVLRFAERMSFADIEEAIDDFADRAQANKLQPQDLEGGTFTITNGGIYGSLLSTPIVNPPQSGVLGMHAIQQRPVARDGQVVIRPMMYVALSYDHRIVDGREAVSFLKRLKETIEEPARMLIEV